MDGSDVWNKHFAVCKRASVISVSDNKDLLQWKEKEKGGKQLDQGIGTNPLHAVKGGKGRPDKPIAAHPNELPGGVPVRIK